MATGDKFERHGGAAERKRSLCRETATSPADGRFSDPIDVTGFTPVTAHANLGD